MPQLSTRGSDAVLVSGYFNSRQKVWDEPIYRNVWGLLSEFGDAEIASLIAPRTLVIEYSQVPGINGRNGKNRQYSHADGRVAIYRL